MLNFAKIKRSRLAIVVAIATFVLGMTYLGQWSSPFSLADTFIGHAHTVDHENYAISRGTTLEQMAQDFYDQQVEAYAEKRKAGLPECGYFGQTGDCARPPLHGTWAIKPDIDFGEYVVASARTIKSKWLLIGIPLFSIAFGLLLVYVAPFFARKFWRWLAPN